jgi:hypothetical protein
MIKVKFRFKDQFTHGEWYYQECTVKTIQQCIDWFGLYDLEYEILEVTKI